VQLNSFFIQYPNWNTRFFRETQKFLILDEKNRRNFYGGFGVNIYFPQTGI